MPDVVTNDCTLPGVIRLWVEAARRALVSMPEESVQGSGVGEDADDAVDDDVSEAWLQAAIQDLERRARTGAFAIQAAASVHPDALGMVSFAWAARPTIGHGIASLARYLRLLAPTLRLRTHAQQDRTHLTLTFPTRTPIELATRAATEFLWAHLLVQLRSSMDVPVQKVTFRHGPVAYRDTYDATFQAPVEFSRDVDSLVLSTSVLEARLPSRDCSMGVRVRRGASRALRGLPEVGNTSAQVREVILDEVIDGIPHMTRVSSRLGMSVPALAGVLKSEGRTFAGLREELLFALVREYLDDRCLALVDVAFASGFEDYDVFVSTFTRWSGDSPRAYRLAA